MTTQSTWTISALNCKPQEGNLTDVVITAALGGMVMGKPPALDGGR